MSKQERYSEILLLEKMLQEGSIEHNRHDLYDGFQIILPLPGQTKEISIIEHAGSYGSVMNLLEIWAEGEIKGFLSAEQTLRIIKNIRERIPELTSIKKNEKERNAMQEINEEMGLMFDFVMVFLTGGVMADLDLDQIFETELGGCYV